MQKLLCTANFGFNVPIEKQYSWQDNVMSDLYFILKNENSGHERNVSHYYYNDGINLVQRSDSI